jgi:hypothetical protein
LILNCQEKAISLYKNGCSNYRKIYCIYNNIKLKELKGFHIHHIDGNHKNNHPENLLKCTPEEHASFHKKENLCNWISLQNYAAVKGGKIAGKLKDTSKQMKKVWNSYTEEERRERVEAAASSIRTQKHRDMISRKLKGKKRPLRSESHILNFKKSISIGTWSFKDIKCLSSSDLGRKLNLPIKNVYRWCRYGKQMKVSQKIIDRYPLIFNKTDLKKTYNEKGFIFTNNN